MEPTRQSGSRPDDDYRWSSQAKVATATSIGKPVLYMLISTALLIMLTYMFALSFGPDTWTQQNTYTRHHVSHLNPTVQPTHLMRI